MLEDFFQVALGLKNVQRKGWKNKLGLKNAESVADHSYSMAIMSMIFSDLQNLDTKKILKMVLLHDLAESHVGDFTPDEVSKDQKNKIENEAMQNIISKLPSEIKNEYQKIWNEYQLKNTKESILVHEIDRLEMAFQAIQYYKMGHSKENIQPFIDSAFNEIKNEKLRNIFTNLLKSQKY